MGSASTARPPRRWRRKRTTEQRLALLVGAVVFLDTMFYAVLAPLLPGLAHQLRMSKLAAGLMTAGYPVGTLLGSIPGGVLAARAGPRLTVCAGLSLLACSTVAFGLLDTPATLDAARFVEGVGGACSWAGGLAWIVAGTPAERRGAVIGRALSAAIAGSLFGPALGAAATATGRLALFSAVAALSVWLIAKARRLPDRAPIPEPQSQGLLAVIRRPAVAAGIWLVALPAIASGLINVLGPLRLHRFDAGTGAIAAAFLAAAALESIVSPLVGALSDRRGRLVPLRGGLIGATAALACFTLPRTALPLAALIVASAAALGAFWAPAMALLADAAERYGLDQALASALMNLAWAGGQIVGAGAGGALAKLSGDLLPTAAAAALCALTLAALAARRPIARAAGAGHKGDWSRT
jgi:MFS family permease